MLSAEERGLIVKLHENGKNQEEISRLIGCSQPTVHRWIKCGLSGRTLQTLPRSGRPTKLTRQKLSRVKKKIISAIKEANDEFCSVSTKQVGKIILQEVGELYSLRHVERIMHRLGFSLITPRPQHIRHDQKKVDQFRDQFKKKFKQRIWAMN